MSRSGKDADPARSGARQKGKVSGRTGGNHRDASASVHSPGNGTPARQLRRNRRSAKDSDGRTQSHEAAASTHIGVVGLGLMGTTIASCLLAAGHQVTGVELDAVRRSAAKRRLVAYLDGMRSEGLVKEDPRFAIGRFSVSGDYAALADSSVVIESIVEDVKVKRRCLREIERFVRPDTIIGSNSSGIPPSLLQRGLRHPDRVLGIHWGDPAHTTRFMEIICGRQTDSRYATQAMTLARRWGKEPSLLRRDIRAFISNRCMYALMREAFRLVEAGYASVEDVDRSVRNDLGYWITFAGPFRFMDLTGIPAYRTVMKDLFPDLDCSKKVPRLIDRLVKAGARGVANAKGFYRYTPRQAKQWEKAFLKFSYEIRALAQRYPEDLA